MYSQLLAHVCGTLPQSLPVFHYCLETCLFTYVRHQDTYHFGHCSHFFLLNYVRQLSMLTGFQYMIILAAY